jgi:hypothetical protein
MKEIHFKFNDLQLAFLTLVLALDYRSANGFELYESV